MLSTTYDLSEAELLRRRSQLGAILRERRNELGLSGDEVARKAELSQPTVSRIERGRVTANPRDVGRIAAVLQISTREAKSLISEAEEIADLAKSYRRERARGLADLQMEHLQSEQLYQTFLHVSTGILPGMLQTPDYARSMLQSLIPAPADADIDQAVAKRVERQAILRDTRRTFDMILTPDALRSHFGDREEMYVQLVHLRSLMRLSNVTIRILDLSVALPTPILCGFTVYDDKRVVVELPHAELYIAGSTEVADYRERFEALASVAMNTVETAKYLDAELAHLQ